MPIRLASSTPLFARVILPCLLLAACVNPQIVDPDAPQTGVQIGYTPDAAPTQRSGEKEPGCWALDFEPAITETVSQDVLVQAEQKDADGTVTSPSVWRNETTTKVLTPRKILNFETPCANLLTEEFLASLQRALQARDVYEGAITSTLDYPTRNAIRSFQKRSGLNSAFLSLESARALDLSEIPRPEGAQDPLPVPEVKDMIDI